MNARIAVLILLLSTASIAQVQYTSVLRGRVVDDHGSAVAGAAITVRHPIKFEENACFMEDETVFSNEAGEFTHREHCSAQSRSVIVYVTLPFRELSSQMPIHAPFWPDLQKSDERFVGRTVTLSGSQLLDLGSVPVQVSFYPVKLFVKNGQLLPFFRTANDWSRFVLIVRNKIGAAAGSDGLSIHDIENTVDIKNGCVMLSLPNGRWTLELLSRWEDLDQRGHTRRYLARTKLNVSGNREPVEAELIVTKPPSQIF